MLEVITGCMYSGKSEELIRRLRRCQIADQFTLVMKPAIDDRYSADSVATHVGGSLKAVAVKDVQDVKRLLCAQPFFMTGQVVGLDEVQFLDDEIVDVLEAEANRGRRVIVAGLDLDSDGNPFGPMARLLAVADKVTKLTAVCVARLFITRGLPSARGQGDVCGKPATRSYRLPNQDTGEQVQVGSDGVYEARCRVCWARMQG
jgi:thymidine kinase